MALSEMEVILLSAMVLPMLMRARRQETTNDTTIEFIGTSQPGGMYANHRAPGTPWSRAKAKSWREAVAVMERLQNTAIDMTMVESTDAPA